MKKYLKYIGVCLFFIIIFCLSPISGDDWGNYIAGSEGLRRSLGIALGMYFDWEGRIVSRVLINILTYHKWLWNIVNAVLITGFIFISEKIIGEKNKKFIFPLVVLIIVGMNPYMFSQGIVWLAGNITYFFVIPVILFYFYYLINNDKYNKWFFIVFSLINIFGTMFVENMALVLVLGNISLILFKYIETKKIDKRLVIYLLLSICSTLVMLLSPGSRYRSSIENTEFNELSFIGKILYNIPNFVYYTYITNTYLLILMSFSNYLLIKDKVYNKIKKNLLIVFMLVIPLITVIVYPISLFTNTGLNFIVDYKNIFIIIYWLVYTFISLNLLFFKHKKDLKIVLWFFIGLISNGVMLVSPTWGFRTSLFTYIVLSIVALWVINKYVKENKKLIVGSYGILVCGLLFYMIFYINIYRCQSNLESSIKKQLKEDSDIIYIDAFPNFANCNINPGNEYHLEKYKLYYGIPEEKEIVIEWGKWKYLIIYIG